MQLDTLRAVIVNIYGIAAKIAGSNSGMRVIIATA
jgi:hypothetical protein